MDISASFQLTASEHRTAIRNSPSMRGLMILSALLTAFGLVTLLLPSPKAWLVYWGVGTLVFLELAGVHWGSRKSAPQFAAPWTVRVTAQTYTLQTAAGHAEIEWSAYSDAVDRAGFWYLRQTNGAAGFIPKRAFTDAQQTEIAGFLTERLPAAKKRWYNPLTW